jgi:predicted NBD/HSP70 family sugar kinase
VAEDLQAFIDRLAEAVAPDLVIIGGGVSAEAHRCLPQIRTRPLVLPARLRNDAGTNGAAAFASDQAETRARNGGATVSQLRPTSVESPAANES